MALGGNEHLVEEDAGSTNGHSLSASTNGTLNGVAFTGIPDGPRIYPSTINRKLAVFGLCLTVTGATSIFVAALANVLEAEKHYQVFVPSLL